MADNHPAAGRPPPTPQREPIYRMIALLMIFDVVIGIALMIYGQLVANAPAMTWAGLGLAVVGIVLFGFFRSLASQRAARR